MMFPRARLSAALMLFTTVLTASGCDDPQPPRAQPAPPAAAVVVTPAVRTAIAPRTEYVGQTTAVDTVDLRARVEGFLIRRAFREGEDVREGALLFALEREPFEAAVERAAARVSEAQAQVVRTRRDLERARTLTTQGNLSQQSLDRALSDQQQAEALLRQSEAELRQARIDLGYTQITAPFDGRIGRSVYSEGQWVGPTSGVMATLVKLDPIHVVFNVSETTYLDYRLKAQEAARDGRAKPSFVPRLTLANGVDYPHPGRFDFVDNRVDPTTGTIAIRAAFDNPDKLLVPGLYVTVAVEPAEPRGALLVPQAAVQEDQTGRYVLVVDANGTVQRRRIVTGVRADLSWEVVSGLVEGEMVIWEGLQKARPGAIVTPTVRAPQTPAG